MDAIWFLDRRPDAELPGYLVIDHEGRFVVDGDRLEGADGKDPLVTRLEPLGPDGLTDAVRQWSARSARQGPDDGLRVGARRVEGATASTWCAGACGPRVTAFTPSLTGVGEGCTSLALGHAGNARADVVNPILYEDLHDIVLVGYSYGGAVVTACSGPRPRPRP